MGQIPTFLNEAFYEFLQPFMVQEPDVLKKLRAATSALPDAPTHHSSPETGQLLCMLIKITGAKQCLELGTFTGYGSLWMASALPKSGRLMTCDRDASLSEIGQPFWQEAGVASKIKVLDGKAEDVLEQLAKDKKTFDFMYIDANKKGYPTYYELALPLLKQGGVMVFDDVFIKTSIMNPSPGNRIAKRVVKLLKMVKKDDRVMSTVLPVGDGVLVVVRQ